jgi:Zn-dependent alcohol dehydrogenase
MRATVAVFEKQFNPLTVTEVEVDSPGPGEALVKIVAAVGDGVTNVAVGDKVVIGWPWCGECRNCLEGQPAEDRPAAQVRPGPAAQRRSADGKRLVTSNAKGFRLF